MRNSQWVKAGLVAIATSVVLLLAACAGVNNKHPDVVSDDITEEAKAQLATVYFIRPWTYKSKSKGFADDEVRIEFQERTLLTQSEGTYLLVYLKPSKGTVKIHSKTLYADQREVVDVWRSRIYKFIAGKTYFIHVRQIDEEFRGIFYEPEPVGLQEAKRLIVPGMGRFGNTSPSGVARSAPIDELTKVNVPPASAVKDLPPAMPEDLFKQKKSLPGTR